MYFNTIQLFWCGAPQQTSFPVGSWHLRSFTPTPHKGG